MELSDHELLARFASTKEDKAFRTLVDRHLPAVWEVARSRTGDVEVARDLAQEAFVLLAHQAGRLRTGTVVSGWLFLTVRNLASKWLRSNARRNQRELAYAAGAAMESTLTADDPAHLKQILVPALDELPAKDRDMVLSRFFENRTCREIAGASGTTEEAVRKRTARALEKLRLILARRGFPTSAAALGGAITGFASTAPPAGLAQAITAASVAAVSGTALISGFSAILGMAQTVKALAAGAVVAVGATAYFAFKPGASAPAPDSRSQVNPAAAAAGSGGPDRARLPATLPGEKGSAGDDLPGLNREGLDPGELRSAIGMAEYLFKMHEVLGKGMPPAEIQKISQADAQGNMKPLKAFLPLSTEAEAAMERILTDHAAKRVKEFFWNDYDTVNLLRGNKAQFIEAMALRLMSRRERYGDTTPELDRRSLSWTPGVKEAAIGFLKSYSAMSKRSNNVIDERDWTEAEATVAAMRGVLPPDQAGAFDAFVTERQVIVREGRALTRSQQLAESLQLDAAQRQAVFEELLKNNRENRDSMEALLTETQRAVYHKK